MRRDRLLRVQRWCVVTRREIVSWLMDMDGVLIREQTVVPGADRFLERLRVLEQPFLVLTNNSMYTQRDLAARLSAIGLSKSRRSGSGPPRWRPRTSSTARGRKARRSSSARRG